MVGVGIFTVKNNAILCIVDDYSKFPAVKKEGCNNSKFIRIQKYKNYIYEV